MGYNPDKKIPMSGRKWVYLRNISQVKIISSNFRLENCIQTSKKITNLLYFFLDIQ
jgi:hypothetical protein